MNTGPLVVAMCALSLGATCFLVVSTPRGGGEDARVAELEKKLEAAEKRADAVDGLRAEVRELKERVDRRAAADSRSVAESPKAPTPRDLRAAEAAPPSSMPMEELAERLEKRVTEKMDALASRESQRGEDGKWKAPIDELGVELKLTEPQKSEAKKVFDRSRDETFTLLKTQRLDGGCLLDDFAAALKGGADPQEATRQFFGRIFSDKIPGTDRSYVAEFMAMTKDVEDALGRQLDAGQMKRLKQLHVDLLDVKTGYDPVGDYIRAKAQ